MISNYSDLIFAILSPFFSSVATVFKSGAVKTLSPLTVVVVGGFLGSLFLFLLARVFKEKVTIHKIRLHFRSLSALVLLRTILGELFFTYGLSQTEVIKAIFFTKIEPYFVLLIGVLFLREKIKLYQIFLLTIHLTGAILLSTGGNIGHVSSAQVGDLFIIIAMALFASSYNYGKRLAHSIGSITSNAVALGVGSLILLPFMVFFSPPTLSWNIGWAYLLIYVILFNVVALTLWFASLRSVRDWIVSALRYIGPVLGAPVAYFLFRETLSTMQIFGAVIIIMTSFLIAREHLMSRRS